MDIVAWLSGLGLEQYASAFRDNDIDADVLPELTVDDLIGLGVASIGHRRKLLAAIAALREAPAMPMALIFPTHEITIQRQDARRFFKMIYRSHAITDWQVARFV